MWKIIKTLLSLNIKKKIFFIVFVLLFLSVFFSLTLRPKNTNQNSSQNQDFILPTPFDKSFSIQRNQIPTPIIVHDIELDDNPIVSISWNIKNDTLPKQSKIYKVPTYSLSEQTAASLATRFGFLSSPSIDTDAFERTTYTWINEQNTEFLSIGLETGYVEYRNEKPIGKTDVDSRPLDTLTNQEEAIKQAKAFLQEKKILSPDIDIKTPRVAMFKNNPAHPEEVSESTQADTYLITFDRSIQGNKIFYQFGVPSSALVLIDRMKVIRKVSLHVMQFIESDSAYTLLTLEEAKRKLSQGEGTLVRTNTTSTQPDALTLHDVSFGYLDDRTSGFIVPLFLFSGKDSSQQDVLLYLPAIH